ncbi:class II aldolase/adducin family protein [Amycolatopsis sp. cmx-4-68]|uniref:class II aldolase/adducin family protein n=1 Tax=Amycolatopsis sp. cmx-4-68 TaxID=2790938 RepID=UPI00397A2B1D
MTNTVTQSADTDVTDTDVAAERVRRQRRLVAAFRLFGRYGFDLGVAGHITARDPERPDHFWVNPLAVPFTRMKVSDLLLLNHEGEVLHGDRPVNHSAFIIHSRIHAARPDVVSVAHAHTTYGTAWAAMARPLDPISQNACVFFEDHVLYDDYDGPVMAAQEGEKIADRLGGAKAAILRNHGLLTVGRSVDEAAWWFIAMDRACQVQLIAEAAGTPTLIDPETARAAREISGRASSGELGFQPLFDLITAEPSDMWL